MPLLIDGFNLIYKFPELEEFMYHNKLSEARNGLIDKLKDYIRITGTQIRVVFDGKKEMSLDIRSEKAGKIDVYYSLDYSADFLIKEFIKKDINPKMTTVVTSDNDIMKFVRHFKAKVKTSEKFAKELEETIEKSLKPDLPEKEENPVLSQSDLNLWEEFFNFKKKKQ